MVSHDSQKLKENKTTTIRPEGEAAVRRPWWRRTAAFLMRWTWRLTGSFVILCALLVVVSQTNVFRQWIKDAALRSINGMLTGTVTVDDIHINLLHGIVLDHPQLFVDSVTVLDAERIELAYELPPLLQNMVVIDALRIIRPVIFIERRLSDSTWNISRIIRPNEDTSATEPPNLTIVVRSVEVIDGSLVVNDRTTEWGTKDQIDPGHASLYDLNISARGRAKLREADYSVAIDRLSFLNRYGDLSVQNLSVVTHISPQGIEVPFLHVKTERSDLHLAAHIRGVDFRNGLTSEDLRKNPLRGVIEADSVWGPDVRFFIRDVDLRGSYSLTGDIVLNGKDLSVVNARLVGGPNMLFTDTHIRNIDGSAPLMLDITVKNSKAVYSDIRSRLGFIPLPPIDFLSTTSLRSVRLRGQPDDSLHFDLDISEAVGHVVGTMSLYLNNDDLGYRLDATVDGGRLERLSRDSTLPVTDLQGTVHVMGRGFDLTTMSGEYNVDLRRSMIEGRQVRSAMSKMRVDSGKIFIDTLVVDLTPFADSQADSADLIDELEFLRIDDYDRQRINVRGVIDVNNTVTTDLRLRTEGLDVSRLLRDEAMPNRMSLDVVMVTSGLDIDSLLGSVQGNVWELGLRDRAMRPFGLRVSMTDDTNTRHLSITTDFATVNIDGVFRTSTLVDGMVIAVSTVTDVVKTRTSDIVGDTAVLRPLSAPLQQLDVTIAADIADVSPVNMFLPDIGLSAAGRFRGRFSVDYDRIAILIDTADVDDFRLETSTTSITADPLHTTTDIVITDLLTSPVVERFTVKGHVDSSIVVNGTDIRFPVVDIALAERGGAFSASASVDGMSALLRGDLTFSDENTILDVDTLSFTLNAQRGLRWHTSRKAQVTAQKGQFTLQELTLLRTGSETVYVDGAFSFEDFRDFTVRMERFPLRDARLFVDFADDHPASLVDGFVTTSKITVNGTWQQPIITSTLEATDLAYNGEVIGVLRTDLRHEGRRVTGTATVVNDRLVTQDKTLNIVVTSLPLDLAFATVEQRLVDGQPIDVSVEARQLSLAAIEPFLPAVTRVRGTADGKVNIRGTIPEDVDFQGSARYDNASFLASSTNMYYTSYGSLRLEGNELIFDTLVVKNLQRDMRTGIARASGKITFDGLAVSEMDFTLRSPGIAVMNVASAVTSPTVYGDLQIATHDNRPIRLHGPLDAPNLEGDIVLLYGNMIWPKERSTTKRKLTSFDYISRRDSSRDKFSSVFDYVRTTRNVGTLGHDSDTLATLDTNKVQRDSTSIEQVVETVIRKSAGSFADILNFDLDIYIEGRTILTMDLGLTEVLIADLELVDRRDPLVFTGKFIDNSTSLSGRVRVKEGASSYKFFKPFSASGTLDFSRGGMADPALDLLAVYKDSRYVGSGTDNPHREEFRVEIRITGSKTKPHLSFKIFRNDREQPGDSTKIAGDALTLILLGRTQDELAQSGQGNIVTEINSSLSAAATNVLGDLLADVGIIQSTQIDIGADISQSRVTVSGQLFGDVMYRVSGSIGDITGNSTFTVTLPLSALGDTEALKYFLIDFSRSVNQTGNVTRNQRDWEIKIGARLP